MHLLWSGHTDRSRPVKDSSESVCLSDCPMITSRFHRKPLPVPGRTAETPARWSIVLAQPNITHLTLHTHLILFPLQTSWFQPSPLHLHQIAHPCVCPCIDSSFSLWSPLFLVMLLVDCMCVCEWCCSVYGPQSEEMSCLIQHKWEQCCERQM